MGFGNAPLAWLLLDGLWAASAASPGVCCQPQAQLSTDQHLPLVSLLALKGKQAAWLGWVTVPHWENSGGVLSHSQERC